jgi:uridine phosphorylase
MTADDALVQPRHFRPFFRKVNRRAFLLFQPQLVQKLAARGGYEAGSSRAIGSTTYLPGRDADDFGIAGPVVGAPAAALAAEFLIALGCREIVAFGICGSLDGRLRIGATAIPVDAVPEDGTSGLYLPGQGLLTADAGLSERVRAAAEAEGLSPRAARTWTTDAFFRETPEKVKRFGALGCRVVEMEFAALAAVASFRGAKVAGLLVVSDELFAGKWKPGFLAPSFRLALRRGLAALLRLRAAR